MTRFDADRRNRLDLAQLFGVTLDRLAVNKELVAAVPAAVVETPS